MATVADVSATLIYAVRYALGRQSYVVSEIGEIVQRNWAEIDDGTRAAIKRDVTEALDEGHAGATQEIRQWRNLLHWLDGCQNCQFNTGACRESNRWHDCETCPGRRDKGGVI